MSLKSVAPRLDFSSLRRFESTDIRIRTGDADKSVYTNTDTDIRTRYEYVGTDGYRIFNRDMNADTRFGFVQRSVNGSSRSLILQRRFLFSCWIEPLYKYRKGNGRVFVCPYVRRSYIRMFVRVCMFVCSRPCVYEIF